MTEFWQRYLIRSIACSTCSLKHGPTSSSSGIKNLINLLGKCLETHQGMGNTQLMFVSDHGFTNFDYKMNVNRWLVDNGYLVPKNGATDLSEIDWSKTKAYALGLNSLYLNLSGREGQGIISKDDYDKEAVKIQNDLMNLKGRMANLSLGRSSRTRWPLTAACLSWVPISFWDMLPATAPQQKQARENLARPLSSKTPINGTPITALTPMLCRVYSLPRRGSKHLRNHPTGISRHWLWGNPSATSRRTLRRRPARKMTRCLKSV